MIECFVDGSCKNNPGVGGYGVVIFESWNNSKIIYIHHEKTDNTTNNREELKAIICATEWLMKNCPKDETCVIYSDSSYCVNILNNWMYTWCTNNWMNSQGKSIENIDLIKTLYYYYSKKFGNCQILKVKGHNQVMGNELADALATFNKEKFIHFSQTIQNQEDIIKNF